MAGDFRNKGLISLRPTKALVQQRRTRSLIVSGVARSGTSMVARILAAAGVPMGADLDDVVFEDRDFAKLFERPSLDLDSFDTLVRQRDRMHAVWGFKRPQLHRQGTEMIGRFRNPAMIVTLRDPVAIAERYAIAEHTDAQDMLATAMDDLQEMVAFARQLTCPVLLVSYEKAVREPERFVENLLAFCGLQRSPDERAHLHRLVEPDRPAYIESARRAFSGYIDGFDGTTLTGWAYQRSLGQPLPLTVFRDDCPVVDCLADRYREDLARSGIDDGRHGFAIDLAGYGFTPTCRITVRVKNRTFELTNSGATTSELGADLDAMQREITRHWASVFG